MTPRNLTPPEKQIWDKVAKTVTPRRKRGAKPVVSSEDFAAMIRTTPPPQTTSRPRPKSLDVNQDKKVRRGRVDIDAKIDLHDMTQDAAYPALVGAVIRASKRNQKCLLVITGKGPRLEGVLRRNFTDWLKRDAIRPLIANYAQAHIRHGGSGAWYVFLKN
jgi:DNA-nicking Smr family endonuclease